MRKLICKRMGCTKAQRWDVAFCERHWGKVPERLAEDYRSTRMLTGIAWDASRREADGGAVAEFEIGTRHTLKLERHIAEVLEARGS